MFLYRSCVPPLQVIEQASQLLHGPQIQFTVFSRTIANGLTSCQTIDITWASISIAVLCFSSISYTVCSIMHCQLIDCSVSLLTPTTTGHRAGFPCAPSYPGTVNWIEQNLIQFYDFTIDPLSYLGKAWCCMPSQVDCPHCILPHHALGFWEWLVSQTPCRHHMKRCMKAIAKGSICNQPGQVVVVVRKRMWNWPSEIQNTPIGISQDWF